MAAPKVHVILDDVRAGLHTTACGIRGSYEGRGEYWKANDVPFYGTSREADANCKGCARAIARRGKPVHGHD